MLKTKLKSNQITVNLILLSFELAIARHLCHRTQRAIEFVNQAEMWGDHGVKQLVASGGVACNNRIRASLQKVN